MVNLEKKTRTNGRGPKTSFTLTWLMPEDIKVIRLGLRIVRKTRPEYAGLADLILKQIDSVLNNNTEEQE